MLVIVHVVNDAIASILLLDEADDPRNAIHQSAWSTTLDSFPTDYTV